MAIYNSLAELKKPRQYNALAGTSTIHPQGLVGQSGGLSPQGERVFQKIQEFAAAQINPQNIMRSAYELTPAPYLKSGQDKMNQFVDLNKSVVVRPSLWENTKAVGSMGMDAGESLLAAADLLGIGAVTRKPAQMAVKKGYGILDNAVNRVPVLRNQVGGLSKAPGTHAPKGLLSGGVKEAYEESLSEFKGIGRGKNQTFFTPNEEIGDLRTIKTQTDNVWHKNPESMKKDSQDYLKLIKKNQGEGSIHYNGKTGFSADFSTSCPQKCSGKGACIYCYVEEQRGKKALGKFAPAYKPIKPDTPYRGEVMAMPKEIINNLNSDGGLRIHSFSDFRPGVDDEHVQWLLSDAKEKGLMTRAITKQPEFIERFADHPNLRVNLSIDELPGEVNNTLSIDQARAMADKYGENIKVRSMAINPEQVAKHAEDPRIDVVTPYHGPTNFNKDGDRTDELINIIKQQNPKIVENVGEERMREITDGFVNMSHKFNNTKPLYKKYAGKLCCEGGNCSKDSAKCGFGLGSMVAWLFPYIASKQQEN